MYWGLWAASSRQPMATAPEHGGRRRVRSAGTPSSSCGPRAGRWNLVPLIKDAVWRADPGQPIGEAVLVEDLLAASLTQERFAAVLMTMFAALALLLAAGGPLRGARPRGGAAAPGNGESAWRSARPRRTCRR